MNLDPPAIAAFCLTACALIAGAAQVSAPASDPWVTMLQAHLECDTMGSRTPTAK